MRSSLAKHIVQRLSSKRVRQIEIRAPESDVGAQNYDDDVIITGSIECSLAPCTNILLTLSSPSSERLDIGMLSLL